MTRRPGFVLIQGSSTKGFLMNPAPLLNTMFKGIFYCPPSLTGAVDSFRSRIVYQNFPNFTEMPEAVGLFP